MMRSAGSMIARASSGSRSSINSVEPLMSANSAVTVLRSPSIGSDATLPAATMICELVEGRVVGVATFLGPIAVPHFLQNRAPRLTDALHAGQINSSFAPHSSQNEASTGLSWLQDGQSIGPPANRFLPHPARPAEGAGYSQSKPRSGRPTLLGRSLHHTSCQLGSLTQVRFVTQLRFALHR